MLFLCHFRAIFLLSRRVLQVCAEIYGKIGLRLLEGVFLMFSSFLLLNFLCILCLCVSPSIGYLCMRKGEKNTCWR